MLFGTFTPSAARQSGQEQMEEGGDTNIRLDLGISVTELTVVSKRCG